MKRETDGFKGWAEVKFLEGKDRPGGQMLGSEGYRNMVNGHEFIPENGWDDPPPYPTGDLATVRHSSGAYRIGWERIWGASATPQNGS